mgnify:CR=1 FL=1
MKRTLTLLLGTLMAGAALALPAVVDGEVRKVDKAAGKITLKHGEIKHLAMPPMTMVFSVCDKGQLDWVKNGDKVKFAAEKQGGQYVVTSLHPAP